MTIVSDAITLRSELDNSQPYHGNNVLSLFALKTTSKTIIVRCIIILLIFGRGTPEVYVYHHPNHLKTLMVFQPKHDFPY